MDIVSTVIQKQASEFFNTWESQDEQNQFVTHFSTAINVIRGNATDETDWHVSLPTEDNIEEWKDYMCSDDTAAIGHLVNITINDAEGNELAFAKCMHVLSDHLFEKESAIEIQKIVTKENGDKSIALPYLENYQKFAINGIEYVTTNDYLEDCWFHHSKGDNEEYVLICYDCQIAESEYVRASDALQEAFEQISDVWVFLKGFEIR